MREDVGTDGRADVEELEKRESGQEHTRHKAMVIEAREDRKDVFTSHRITHAGRIGDGLPKGN